MELDTCVRDRAVCDARLDGAERKLEVRTVTAAAARATPIVLPAEDSGPSTLAWVLALAGAMLAGFGIAKAL